MKSYTLKPFKDSRYRSIEDAIKELEALPDPVDDGSGSPPTTKPPVAAGTPELESRIIQMDNLPADNGSKKAQNQWIDYWNSLNDGRIFASMPDYYQAFKQLKDQFEHGSAKEKKLAKTVIDSLREDFDWPSKNNWLISSTRIKYQPNKENAQMIHHYDCNKKLAIKTYSLPIPEYSGVLINDVLDNTKGLAYLQTFFGTKDNKDIIIQNLEFISNKPRSEIKVWTPPFTHNTYTARSQRPERASGFGYFIGGFHVSGSDGLLSGNGRSRGVRIIAAGATPKNKSGVQ